MELSPEMQATAERMHSYHRGEPLNEDLAEIRSGERQTFEQIAAQRTETSEQDTALTRSDKAALRAVRRGDAWPAFLKLAKITVQKHELSAIVLSQDDPLENSAKIANAWAYAKMAREIWTEIALMVQYAADNVESEETR